MTSVMTKKMMTAIATVTVSALLMVPAAQARGGFFSGDRMQSKFDRMDTSGDGVLELTELQARKEGFAERMFNWKDTDGDGFLSLEEATTFHRGQANDYSDIAEEIVQCVADEKAATGNDDIIVPDVSKFQSPEDRFNEADTSGDGLLDLTEVEARSEARQEEKFNDMDADADGFVTFDEFSDSYDARRATRTVIRSCINELSEDTVV